MSRRRVSFAAALGLAAACGGGPPPAAAPAPAVPTAAPTGPLALRVTQVNGTELHYVDIGSGIPVVFIHGSLGTLDDWRAQLDTFARHYRVIAYSRRYHPPNPQRRDGRAYGLYLHADDLVALLDRLGVERAHLIGDSYGAYIALAFALQHPDRVQDLVLDEPPILPWVRRTPEGDVLGRAFDANTLAPVRAAFARGDSVEALRRFVAGVSGSGGRAAPLTLAFELHLELQADPEAYMPSLDCREVAAIRSPVLVVTGERSARIFHVIAEELTRCLRTEEVVTVPGAGHDMQIANARFFNAAVLGFLARN
jgi:non-heme chloroperoxidase